MDSGPARGTTRTAPSIRTPTTGTVLTWVKVKPTASLCLCLESDPVHVALLVTFLFILPVLLLFLALRFPRFRRSLFCLGPNSPFHKARQHNR